MASSRDRICSRDLLERLVAGICPLVCADPKLSIATPNCRLSKITCDVMRDTWLCVIRDDVCYMVMRDLWWCVVNMQSRFK